MCILLLTQHVKSSVQFSIGFDFSCFFLSPFCFYTDVFETKKQKQKSKCAASQRLFLFVYILSYLKHLYVGAGWWFFTLFHTKKKTNKATSTHTDTHDTHLHRKKNNFLIRKAVWPPNWTCFRPPFLTCISCDWSYVVFRTKCVY